MIGAETSAIIVDGASWMLIVAGSVFLIVGGIGLLRLPDVYTRMHAASITDTLGAGLLTLGLTVQAGFSLVAVKLLLILAFIFFTSPAAAHAVAHAAHTSGLEPVIGRKGGRS